MSMAGNGGDMEARAAPAMTEGIWIHGPRLVLRPFQPDEIDDEWRAMATADPMTIGMLPDEVRFKARLRESGTLVGGRVDLAITLDGAAIGRIQTFLPPGRAVAPGTFDIGIALREQTRGKGYGREALTLLAGWLFEHQDAQVVEAPTDAANIPMRTVFDRVGWTLAGTVTEIGRDWLLYQITREQWAAR
jgi:RimJ/RimL family protein N-acetyltransferase